MKINLPNQYYPNAIYLIENELCQVCLVDEGCYIKLHSMYKQCRIHIGFFKLGYHLVMYVHKRRMMCTIKISFLALPWYMKICGCNICDMNVEELFFSFITSSFVYSIENYIFTHFCKYIYVYLIWFCLN